MALPRDLVRTVIRYLPLYTLRTLPVSFTTWLQQRGIIINFTSPLLTVEEQQLKAATFAGEVDYTSLLFTEECDVNAAADPNALPLLRDFICRSVGCSDASIHTALRAQNYPALAWQLAFYSLRQLDDRTILKFLLAGEYVITPTALRLFQEAITLQGNNAGHHPLFDGLAGEPVIDHIMTCCGLLLIGQPLPSNTFASTAAEAYAICNMPMAVPDNIALRRLAYRPLQQLPKTGQREFPANVLHDIEFYDPRTLRERAVVLVSLIPELYYDSAQRNEYLLFLHFLLDPTITTDPALQTRQIPVIPLKFALLFTRFDLIPLTVERDIKFQLDYTSWDMPILFRYCQNPAALYRYILNIYDEEHFNVSEVESQEYLRRILAYTLMARRGSELSSFASPLETFRNVTERSTTIKSSFLLQYIFNEIQFREAQKSLLIFLYENVDLTHEVLTAYEAETWRAFGITVVPKPRTNKTYLACLEIVKSLMAFI